MLFLLAGALSFFEIAAKVSVFGFVVVDVFNVAAAADDDDDDDDDDDISDVIVSVGLTFLIVWVVLP